MLIKVQSSLFAVLLALAALPVMGQSADHPVGWRNDGTGKFPTATPPTTWSRLSKSMQGVRFQAAKPGEGPSGQPMPDGVIRQWLVLGPVPAPDDENAIDKETIPGEGKLSPAAEGQPTAGLAWKAVNLETAWLNFPTIFGNPAPCVVYAHTYVYSDVGGKFDINQTTTAKTRVWINSKEIKLGGTSRLFVTLQKGWNHLLLKVQKPDMADHWYADLIFAAGAGAQYDQSHIAWFTPLPMDVGATGGAGGPIVVGDRIFLQIEPNELACLNKGDGHVLWIRPNTYADGATEQEKQGDPALQHAAEITTRLRDIDDALAAGVTAARQEAKEKLDKELFDTLKKAADKKFRPPRMPDVGYAGYTPTSDGHHVWAWFGSGLMTCYDLDGNRQWIKLENHVQLEHGFATSPLLLDGKVMMYMREFMAFDAKSGQIAWRQTNTSSDGVNYPTGFYGSFAAASVGGVPVFMDPNGDILRAADGKILFSDSNIAKPQEIPSPVLENGVFYKMTTAGSILFEVGLPRQAGDALKPVFEKSDKIPLTGFPDYYLPWHTASPLVCDGLVYLYNNSGVLSVVDAATLQVVYQKLLDVDHFQWANEGSARGVGISPVLAGNHVYFFGDAGACIVIEPGRAYKQIAKNKIENIVNHDWRERPERIVANPFFDADRIYYRGESGLWCIGEK